MHQSDGSLLQVIRFNWTGSDEEARTFNEWHDTVGVRELLRKRGVVRAARYRIEQGPVYVGWKGPSHAYQYLHVYELAGGADALEQAVQPLEQDALLMSWPGKIPLAHLVKAVSVVYRRDFGQVDLPLRTYCLLQNWMVPAREHDYNTFSVEVIHPEALQRPGLVCAARFTAVYGPAFLGWTGPSRTYRFFKMYEMEDTEEAARSALLPTRQVAASAKWQGGNILEMINEYRAVYRRIGDVIRC